MICPRCKTTDLSVIDSRDCDQTTIRRRRECQACEFRFTTYERIEPIKIIVEKHDGSFEPYSREKLTRGISLAIEKRNILPEVIENIVDRIEQRLFKNVSDRIPSRKIGNEVIRELRSLDPVAYLRFTSVYRGFENLAAFERELAKFKNN